MVKHTHVVVPKISLVVYYEGIKRQVKRRPIYECRCDERLKTRGIYTTDMYCVTRWTGTPKDRDEINRREVCECDGCVCVLEEVGIPQRLRFTRKTTDLVRMFPILDFRWEENTARRKWNSPLLHCAS